MGKSFPLHGRDHRPGGADPTDFGWEDVGVSASMSLANIIKFGTGLEVTDEGDGVIRVDAEIALARNLGQLGSTVATSLSATKNHTIDVQNVREGDGILVLAMAPSLPVLAGSIGVPASCSDSAGNTYTLIHTSKFEAASPAVNEGGVCSLFFCESSVSELEAGVDTITATWDNSVYDRVVIPWLVRHDGGANTPNVLASTADNDAAVYAASSVTLAVPAWTPSRSALVFALYVSFRPTAGSSVSYGGVGGWSGFYEASDIAVNLSGGKQKIGCHQQTHGAEVYIQVGDGITTNEIDLAALESGVLQSGFNGAAQAYYRPYPTPETNVWKGIILLGID